MHSLIGKSSPRRGGGARVSGSKARSADSEAVHRRSRASPASEPVRPHRGSRRDTAYSPVSCTVPVRRKPLISSHPDDRLHGDDVARLGRDVPPGCGPWAPCAGGAHSPVVERMRGRPGLEFVRVEAARRRHALGREPRRRQATPGRKAGNTQAGKDSTVGPADRRRAGPLQRLRPLPVAGHGVGFVDEDRRAFGLVPFSPSARSREPARSNPVRKRGGQRVRSLPRRHEMRSAPGGQMDTGARGQLALWAYGSWASRCAGLQSLESRPPPVRARRLCAAAGIKTLIRAS